MRQRARQQRREPDLPRGAAVVAAQAGKDAGQRQGGVAAEFELTALARMQRGRQGERGDRLGQVVDVQRGDAAAGIGGEGMHRQARQPAQPARCVSVGTIEQRRPDDAPVGGAALDGALARELGAHEAAAGVVVQGERGDMHQAHRTRGAGLGERRGGQVMHAVIGLLAALAQDPDAVDHDVDAIQQRIPGARLEQRLEARGAARATHRADRQAGIDAQRVAAADDDAAMALAQRGDDMATDEAGATQHQDLRFGVQRRQAEHAAPSVCSVLTEI